MLNGTAEQKVAKGFNPQRKLFDNWFYCRFGRYPTPEDEYSTIWSVRYGNGTAAFVAEMDDTSFEIFMLVLKAQRKSGF